MTPHRRTPNFDRIARPYRLLETLTFGRALERCRTHFLPRLVDRNQALVLGGGDGRFLAALLAANPHLEADAVDTSAAMLRLLERRAQAIAPHTNTRLRTHQTSALAFTPKRSYDLIATHFFLDCLTQPELEQLCTRIAPHLTSQAIWLISDFRIPTGPMRWPARILVRSLYLGFRLLTGLRTTALPNHAAALTGAGLTRIAHHHSLAGILTTELWQSREYTSPMLPLQHHKSREIDDPLPDPEPASPSLPGPDPGVFHREPGDPQPTAPKPFPSPAE